MNDPLKSQVIKLNIGCGDDFILGYRNLDLNPTSPQVEKIDISNLDSIIEPNSVDEIRAIDCLQMMPLQMIPNALRNWIHKMKKGAQITIQNYDAQVVSNSVAYEQISIQDYNTIVYGTSGRPHKSLISVGLVELLLKEMKCKIQTKSLHNSIFTIRAIKDE